MSSIVINTKYVDVKSPDGTQAMGPGYQGHFFISSTLANTGFSENQQIVIASPEMDDLRFVAEGIITKVGKVVRPEPKLKPAKIDLNALAQKEKLEHHFDFEVTKTLKDNNLLSDLEYSLRSVYRYNKPTVHFHQQQRELPKEDFDTIVNGWVYAARTVFGKLANSLPRQNKLEFMLLAMDKFSTVDFKRVPLETGLDFLYKYIERRILSRGRLLVETNKLIAQHLSDLVPVNEIGFIDPKTEKYNTLHKQAEIFQKIFALESKSDLRKVIKKGISENSGLEVRFLEIFKNETWPIDLRS